MRKRISVLMVFFAAAAVPLASAAADEVGSGQQLPSFEQIDANHDGMLSRSEIPDDLQDMRMHFAQYAYANHRITRETYAWYASSEDRLLDGYLVPSTFAKPHNRYAFSQTYIRAQAPGAKPAPSVHKR